MTPHGDRPWALDERISVLPGAKCSVPASEVFSNQASTLFLQEFLQRTPFKGV